MASRQGTALLGGSVDERPDRLGGVTFNHRIRM